ncbi:MAG: recombinase family protein [Clostridia bacterium]|nr:recombinase family protein [Clostridia bacterium]
MARTKKQTFPLGEIPAVIYARFSSHNQREESIEQQIAECKAYAAANNLSVVAVYADSAVSGRSDRRPQYQKLRRDAEKGNFAAVIAYKSSRIARNMVNALIFESEMDKYGIQVFYAKEAFADNASGRFARRTMMNLNQFYSENLSEDIKRNQADNALKCRANGPAPYGYKSDKTGHFVVDEAAAPIVKEIFSRVLAGEMFTSIVRDLNSRGIPNSRGNKWNKNSFTTIISNERYTGTYVFNGIRVEGGMPQIIDKRQFEEVQYILKNKKNPRGKSRTNERYLLTGLLFCGECGEPMIGMCGTSKSGIKHHYYTCRDKRLGGGCKKKDVRRDQLEHDIALGVYQHILNDSVITQIAEGVARYFDEQRDNPDIAILEERQKTNDTAIQNIMRAIEAGVFTDTTKSRLLELESEQAKIKVQLAELTANIPEINIDELKEFLLSFRNGDIDDPQYREDLIKNFVVAIYLYDDHAKIVFDPSGGGHSGVNITITDVESALNECSPVDRIGSPKKNRNFDTKLRFFSMP